MNPITSACKTILEISKTSSRNAKIELLKTCTEPEALKFLLEVALDPYMHYGVKEFPSTETKRDSVPTIEELQTFKDKLVRRELTGNAAREAFAEMLCLPKEHEETEAMLRACFLKNLRIGVAGTSINKVFPKLIREFNVQLCDKISDDIVLQGKWACEPKLDGLRCIMIFEDREVTVLSRNGKELHNLDVITDELKKYIRFGVLDGEVYGGTWNESTSVARSSKAERDIGEVKYYVFDCLSLEDWKAQKVTQTYVERRMILEDNIPDGLQYTSIVPVVSITTLEKAKRFAKQFKDQGYEGAVIKRVDSVYSFSRTQDWLKIKFSASMDIEVVAVEEGSGRHKGRLGALVCKLPNGNLVNVGGGFTDVQREEIWKDRATIIGQIAEVEYQPPAEGETADSLRFPVFLNWRPDLVK